MSEDVFAELTSKFQGYDPESVSGSRYTIRWSGTELQVGHNGFFRAMVLRDLASDVAPNEIRDLWFRVKACTESRKKAEAIVTGMLRDW